MISGVLVVNLCLPQHIPHKPTLRATDAQSDADSAHWPYTRAQQRHSTHPRSSPRRAASEWPSKHGPFFCSLSPLFSFFPCSKASQGQETCLSRWKLRRKRNLFRRHAAKTTQRSGNALKAFYQHTEACCNQHKRIPHSARRTAVGRACGPVAHAPTSRSS
jgi:hypothetical protein